MSNAILMHLTAELLWLVLMLSLPVVIVAAAVGIGVALVQALTQVQDQTVQFLVKLLAVCFTLAATYHWAGSALLNYSDLVFNQIVNMKN